MRRKENQEQPPREVVTYPPDAILDVEHVALVLGMSPRTVEVSTIPFHKVGQSRKYIYAEVLAHVASLPPAGKEQAA